MRSNNKIIIIIIISILIILAIVGGIFAYLFLMTDMFKSNQELFAKYLLQNQETIQELSDIKTVKIYEELDNQSKYEMNTKVNMSHSEGGEISNPINNLSIEIDAQKNDDESYFYADGKILYEDEMFLETEIIKEQENYGIRFAHAEKQFITITDDENLEAVAKILGVTTEQIKTLINLFDKNEAIISDEQYSTLKDKYWNIISKAISNSTFEKQKDSIITYNDATIKTNAYSAYLGTENVENLLIEILNNVKTETEILDEQKLSIDEEQLLEEIDELITLISEEIEVPTIKIIVYEQKQKNIRTQIEIGVHKIIIDNAKQEGTTQSKIKYVDMNDEQETQYECEIVKKNIESREDIKITFKVTSGENVQTITFSNIMKEKDEKIELDTEISYVQDITTISIKIENEISIGNDFEKIQTLENGDCILLNKHNEEKRQEVINLLNEIVPQKTTERINLIKEKIGKDENSSVGTGNLQTENTGDVGGMTQVEINKFNAKFEFYTGDKVSSENVKMLLDIVKNNISGHSIKAVGQEGEKEKNVITLHIKKDSTKEESITQILEKIEKNKKYKVSITYKEGNGLIDTITISEI